MTATASFDAFIADVEERVWNICGLKAQKQSVSLTTFAFSMPTKLIVRLLGGNLWDKFSNRMFVANDRITVKARKAGRIERWSVFNGQSGEFAWSGHVVNAETNAVTNGKKNAIVTVNSVIGSEFEESRIEINFSFISCKCAVTVESHINGLKAKCLNQNCRGKYANLLGKYKLFLANLKEYFKLGQKPSSRNASIAKEHYCESSRSWKQWWWYWGAAETSQQSAIAVFIVKRLKHTNAVKAAIAPMCWVFDFKSVERESYSLPLNVIKY